MLHRLFKMCACCFVFAGMLSVLGSAPLLAAGSKKSPPTYTYHPNGAIKTKTRSNTFTNSIRKDYITEYASHSKSTGKEVPAGEKGPKISKKISTYKDGKFQHTMTTDPITGNGTILHADGQIEPFKSNY